MKRSFFQATVVSILLYGCTTWTLTKQLEKKLDGNYTRMLRAILNKSWQQHPTRRQLYGHLTPITKTIQARRTRYAGHCWKSKDEIVSDVLLWTPADGQSKAGRPARTFIQQLGDDTGCNPVDLPEAMNDRETWRERVRDIRASRTTWWWWNKKGYNFFFKILFYDRRVPITPFVSTSLSFCFKNDIIQVILPMSYTILKPYLQVLLCLLSYWLMANKISHFINCLRPICNDEYSGSPIESNHKVMSLLNKLFRIDHLPAI